MTTMWTIWRGATPSGCLALVLSCEKTEYGDLGCLVLTHFGIKKCMRSLDDLFDLESNLKYPNLEW